MNIWVSVGPRKGQRLPASWPLQQAEHYWRPEVNPTTRLTKIYVWDWWAGNKEMRFGVIPVNRFLLEYNKNDLLAEDKRVVEVNAN